MKQAALQEIFNFVQIEEESLSVGTTPMGSLGSRLRLAGAGTVEQAEILLNNILSNDNAWTISEPPPKPTPKKRGIIFLSPEDIQEAKKSMKEKGIKSEDVKNLPPNKLKFY